jgi:hypothetical protein
MTAVGGPLPKGQVPATAKWVVHLDMEKFAPSQARAAMMSRNNGSNHLQQYLDHCRQTLGLDPFKDLQHITLFGNQVSGQQGVALISGNLNSRTIVARLHSHPGYQVKQVGKLALHTWRDKGTGTPMQACFYSPRMLLAASDESLLMNAVEVLNGKAESLATAKSLPVPAETGGTFLIAATRGFSDAPQEPIKALILKNTEYVAIDVGETKGVVDGKMVLKSPNPDAAGQIEQVLNGLVVSASLASNQTGLAKLAEMSEISRNGTTIQMRLKSPAAEAAEVLESLLP